MLEELVESLKGKYTSESITELERAEMLFPFSDFNSEIALEIGNLIVKHSKNYAQDIAVRIIRESDEHVVFQYIGNTKSNRNIDYLMMKRNTVLKCHHCSLWAMASQVVSQNQEEVFSNESHCLPVGGAFPIFKEGLLVGTIAVSGLKNGLDHAVIVSALADYFKVEVPPFSEALV